MKNNINPFENPWKVRKNPIHSTLARLWSESNNFDVLRYGRLDHFLHTLQMVSAAALFVIVGVACIISYYTHSQVSHIFLIGGWACVIPMSSYRLFTVIGSRERGLYCKFMTKLNNLSREWFWRKLCKQVGESDVVFDIDFLLNTCDKLMIEKCIMILDYQSNGEKYEADDYLGQLRELSELLNEFGLGRDWKFYFDQARILMAGNDWVI